MYLIEIFVPIVAQEQVGKQLLCALTRDLVEKFGGVTAHARAPATGLWRAEDESASKDDLVIVEVMVPTIDEAWWSMLRKRLERDLDQESVLIRASETRVL